MIYTPYFIPLLITSFSNYSYNFKTNYSISKNSITRKSDNDWTAISDSVTTYLSIYNSRSVNYLNNIIEYSKIEYLSDREVLIKDILE
jgi:hypothetical protein